jgi:hypothetical protein
MRLALFVGSLIVLWALGVRRSILMLVLAAGISLALSYVLLRKQRDELAQALADRTRARLDKRLALGQADADAEDALVEKNLAEQNPAEQNPAEKNLAEKARVEQLVPRDGEGDGKQDGIDQAQPPGVPEHR